MTDWTLVAHMLVALAIFHGAGLLGRALGYGIGLLAVAFLRHRDARRDAASEAARLDRHCASLLRDFNEKHAIPQ
jgi:hypothetical protein